MTAILAPAFRSSAPRLSVLRAASVLLVAAAAASAQTKLLRFPDVHEDTKRVVFTYAGDLWTASDAGGTAVRLTSHPGLELFGKFSPDGKWIAFTGQYDGDEQVYVMPATGGEPKQLTFFPARGPLTPRWGFDHQVYGWTRDGKSVLFRSMREGFDLTDTRLYTVPASGGLPVALEMPVSGGGDLSPDEKRVVYSPLTRDFRTWKRYEGGWAQDLYVYDRATAALTPVSHHKRTERDPMWIGDAIWFVSDRSGVLNLLRFDLKTQETKQITRETEWDVRWASRGETTAIVYELNGELRLLDVATETSRAIPIHVPTDALAARPGRVPTGRQVFEFGLSPKGERALVVARGDVYTAPIEKGSSRNLTDSSDAHDRVAAWSPDGAKIAFVSDRTGEEEIWIVAQDGATPAERLTTDGEGRRRRRLQWSPDGKRLLCGEQSGKLWIYDVAAKTGVQIAKDGAAQAGDATWSPDGAYVAMSLGDPNGFRSLWIWSVAESKLRRITDEMWNEREPVFDPNGDFLWYLSDRSYAPLVSGLEWNFATDRQTGVFGLALRKDVKHPFAPESDEVETPKAEAAASKPAGDTKPAAESAAAAVKPIVIEWEGLAGRAVRVPVDADNLGNLTANKEHLFWVRSGAFYYGRDSYAPSRLEAFSLKDRKATTLVDDLGGYELSADGSKLVTSEGGGLFRYDASAKGRDSKKAIPTGDLAANRDPRAEWRTIYWEVWRRYRDLFYVENMHGYDWKALGRRYAEWLPHVAHRSDLNYLMGELIAELNVGHAYVEGGDYEVPARPRTALLGCEFALDAASGRYRIAKIFPGQNEEETYRSPLTEVGVDIREGDYLLAIDGVELRAPENPYRLLRYKADRALTLNVAADATGAGARKVAVRPISSEANLRYLAWTAKNRATVDRLSGGRLAYVHIPDMSEDGMREFVKWYFGQVRKEGLIVDDRNNGGGNISQMVIERLRRVLLGTEFTRNVEFTGTYPQVVFNGPMACLLNENSASDGDIFPWMFRQAGLGPLIGKRSWGGVVGISGRGPLLDGGQTFVPEFGNADAKGQWAVEGHGVDPDIVIENDPASIIAGRDPQLERAVAEVLKAAEAKKAALPTRPAPPVK
jgi:tricorn protease